MISTIIFSKDRPAQLDLLIRSALWYAPDLVRNTHVIWTASEDQYRQGYALCERDHLDVVFHEETDFARNLYSLVWDGGKHIIFLCDDDVFYRRLPDPFPTTILDWKPDVLTVSLRLGKNTSECYSLNRFQGVPYFKEAQRGALIWEWRGCNSDWGYPGSLDGNVWHNRDIIRALSDFEPGNPNQFEEALNRSCQDSELPYQACYMQSILVGVPVNMVNQTHTSNRYGEQYLQTTESLNSLYLKGERLNTRSIKANEIDAAHCEQRLSYKGSALATQDHL